MLMKKQGVDDKMLISCQARLLSSAGMKTFAEIMRSPCSHVPRDIKNLQLLKTQLRLGGDEESNAKSSSHALKYKFKVSCFTRSSSSSS